MAADAAAEVAAGEWQRLWRDAIRDPREMVVKHVLDSAAMHPFVRDLAQSGGSVADLGAGAQRRGQVAA